MNKNEKMRLIVAECRLWLAMSNLNDEEKLRRIGSSLDELQKMLAIPRKQYVIFGEK